MKLKNLLSMLILLSLVLFVGCSTVEEKAQSQSIDYLQFDNDDFSVMYPDWPAGESDAELSVTKGYCSVVINSEKLGAEQWYSMIAEAVKEQGGKIIASDKSKNAVTYSTLYQNITIISDNRIYDCDGNAIAVTLACAEHAYNSTIPMKEKIFGSAECKKDEAEESQQEKAPEYLTFEDDDFSVMYPAWERLQDNSEHLVGVSKGVCSIVIDKHNALPNDIYNWYIQEIKENAEHDLVGSSVEGETYHITYKMPYEDKIVTSESKILYCNYQSYITQVLCINSLITDDYSKIRDEVIKSAKCAREYEVPTPEKISEAKKEAEEKSPEEIKDIKDEIVKTDAGKEFGIDEEAVVYFINNNEFFTKIMKDFPKANIIIEDDGRELDLRVTVGSDGKIKLLEDGKFNDADVTLKVPLRDALNIFSNAQNINPLTLLGFAVNVRTDPPEIKDQIIQKVLRGEYK